MSSPATSLLPETLDTSAASPLRIALLDRIDRGEPVHLDGSEVTRAGLACLQVLASARATAVEQDVEFRLEKPSEALARMIGLAGLDEALALSGDDDRDLDA
ncbi:STAS domain-containing protein [Sphingomonas melonis]|jgi:chemotaxis protein CheX|uniref:Chemotaxis protein CheX n=1 Tax=Sphingomonas melonis TaxID=152682 RepID=A0A7Y9K3Q6_9SPHN|nr:STAS domain-containing protein [Sphingomonas melonis]NYD92132.1 chemotaxis protein CheX [Sphingomonas melonis]